MTTIVRAIGESRGTSIDVMRGINQIVGENDLRSIRSPNLDLLTTIAL
jgi:hypothetical protein